MALEMAVNVENAPARFQLTLADSRYTGPAVGLFENRQVEVRGGGLEDLPQDENEPEVHAADAQAVQERGRPYDGHLPQTRGSGGRLDWIHADSAPCNDVRTAAAAPTGCRLGRGGWEGQDFRKGRSA